MSTFPTDKIVPNAVIDRLQRPLRSLRVSVIDRCDLRCRYCMPEEHYAWLPKGDLLGADEIEQTVSAFAKLGVDRVRITGGEPLLRARLEEIVERIAHISSISDLAMTTNGMQLAQRADDLRRAGLRRVTISLDSLDRARLQHLTRRDALASVLRGIDAAITAFDTVKINTVVIRDFNDDELVDLIEYGKGLGAEIRFIEYMDVGGATNWSQNQVVDRREILTQLEQHYGPIATDGVQGAAPAARFRLQDGTRFGIIASVSQPFCGACDRSRLTADGLWYLCLYAGQGHDLRTQLRAGVDRQTLVDYIRSTWEERSDRGAEVRLETPARGALFQIDDLREDPHREMHTRGG